MTERNEGKNIFESFAQIRNMKKNMEDHLKLMIQLTFEVLQYKIIKCCYIFIFFQYSLGTSLIIYHLISAFDQNALLKHGSFCGIQIFYTLACIYITKHRTNKKRWKIWIQQEFQKRWKWQKSSRGHNSSTSTFHNIGNPTWVKVANGLDPWKNYVVLINLGVLLYSFEDFSKFVKSYRLIIMPIELMKGKIYEDVVSYTKIVKLISCFNMSIAIVASFGFVLSPEYVSQKAYLPVLIEEIWPDYAKYLFFVWSLTSIPVALLLAGSPVAWSYVVISGVFQLKIINEAVKAICTTGLPRALRRDSEIYQQTVKQKMVICITIHMLIMRYLKMGLVIIEIPCILFSIGSVILGGSLMIEFLSNQGSDQGPQFLIRIGIICFVVSGMISSTLYVLGGQWTKDESEKTYYLLTQLPWYDMDKDNKKIFSFFLRSTQEPLTIKTTFVQVDYMLLLRIIKALYSVAALLVRLVSNSSSSS